MEKLSALLTLCGGNPSMSSGFPHKGPVIPSFDVFFAVSLNNLFDNQVAGDFRWYNIHVTSL